MWIPADNPHSPLQLSVSTSSKPGLLLPPPPTVANEAWKNKCFRLRGLAFPLTLQIKVQTAGSAGGGVGEPIILNWIMGPPL